MIEQPIQIIGLIATIILSTSSIPQIIECYKNGHANGVSLGMLSMWFMGLFLMLAFTIATKSETILIINYAVNTFFVAIILRYKIFPTEPANLVIYIKAYNKVKKMFSL